MPIDPPPPRSQIPELNRFERNLLKAVALGSLGVGGLGLYSSYDSVSAAAARWNFDPAWILPVALDISIPVFSLANLLLIRFDMALSWVRFVPWALTAVTVYLNVVAAGESWAARLGHGALPLLWVTCSEIVAHVYRVIIGAATGRRMERVRRSRWMLAPISTARLWRRMVLWEVTSYRTGLQLESRRLLARAELRDRLGWRWRRKVKRVDLVRLRAGELEPTGGTEPAPVPFQSTPEVEREPVAAIAPDPVAVPEPHEPEPVEWNEPEPVEPDPLERNEPDPVEPVEPVVVLERNEPDPVEPSGTEPVEVVVVPEPTGTERVERPTGTADLPDRASKKEQQVRAVLELVERYGMERVTPKFVNEQTGIPPTTAFRRIQEAKGRLERGETTGAGGTERSQTTGTERLQTSGTMIGTERTGT